MSFQRIPVQNQSQSRGGDGDFVILCCRKSAARLKLNADTLLSLSVNIHPWMPTRLFRAALHCIMPHWSLLAELEFRSLQGEKRSGEDVARGVWAHLGRLMKAARLPDWLLLSPGSSREATLTEHSSLLVMERARSSGAGSVLHASLRKCREVCKKGEQTWDFPFPVSKVCCPPHQISRRESHSSA